MSAAPTRPIQGSKARFPQFPALRRGDLNRPEGGRSGSWGMILAAILAVPGMAACDRATAGGATGGEIGASRRTAIVQAAERAGPSVVAVHTYATETVAAQPRSPFEAFFGWDYLAPRYFEREVSGLGSGVIIDARGFVVTNHHVVDGAERIELNLTDGRQFPAELVGADPPSDLALLRVVDPPEDLPKAVLGNSDSLLIGEWAVAIGNPFGDLIDDPQPTVTAGVISALHRDVKSGADTERIYRDMIQTDASINPGNSGGALVNGDGEVIGINTFIFSKSGGSLGIGFAIPANRVQKVVADLARYGEVRPAWIGLRLQRLDESLARALDLDEVRGALVAEVVEGSPADEARIREGDVLLRFGSRTIRNPADLDLELAQRVVGEEVEVVVLRKNRERRTHVKLVEVPHDTESREFPALGMRGEDVGPRLARRYAFRSRRGVVITALGEGSPLARSGAQVGDVIVGYGPYQVNSVQDLEHLIAHTRPGTRVVVMLERRGRYHQLVFLVR